MSQKSLDELKENKARYDEELHLARLSGGEGGDDEAGLGDQRLLGTAAEGAARQEEEDQSSRGGESRVVQHCSGAGGDGANQRERRAGRDLHPPQSETQAPHLSQNGNRSIF